jgi:hypothetical protein
VPPASDDAADAEHEQVLRAEHFLHCVAAGDYQF